MTPPNPGSDDAVRDGCTCPILDNNRGRGRKDGTFWITEHCPLHDRREPVRDEPDDAIEVAE